MKQNELMIGDWVYNTRNRKNEKVGEIGSGLVMLDHNDLYEYDEVQPVPLTEEILERNGFDKKWHDKSKCYISDQRNDEVTSIVYNHYSATVTIEALPFIDVNKENEREQKIEAVRCRYVHELQHALRLCGIEKEIEL